MRRWEPGSFSFCLLRPESSVHSWLRPWSFIFSQELGQAAERATERPRKGGLFAPVPVALVHSFAEPVFRNPSSVGLIAFLLGLGANRNYFYWLKVKGSSGSVRSCHEAPRFGASYRLSDG